MSGIFVGLLSVLVILLLIYSGMYVTVALGLVSFVSVWLIRDSLDAPVYLLTLAASNSLEDYIFGVIPLFVLMGLLVGQSELGRDIYEVSNSLLRRVRGGLGVATVVANAAFAAITGISIASASVFTRVAVPEMMRFGYKPRFAVGVVAGSSVLGMLIPPSVMLIIYAIITEQSVAAMFTAGIVPGLILSAAFIVAIVSMAVFFPVYVGGQDKFNDKDFVDNTPILGIATITGKISPLVLLVLLVLGGIYGGIFTPTEAGAVGALGALITTVVKRKLDRQALWRLLVETGHIVASILMLIVAATMYSRMLAMSGLPNELGEWIGRAEIGLYGIMAIYAAMLIVLGTMIDTTSIILIMVPLFMPVMMQFDISLVWFGIVTIVGAEIGLLTPPLGISCYVIKSTLDDERISLYDIFAGAFPFAVIMLFVLILLVLFPALSLVLL